VYNYLQEGYKQVAKLFKKHVDLKPLPPNSPSLQKIVDSFNNQPNGHHLPTSKNLNQKSPKLKDLNEKKGKDKFK
jgi:hypothetical protein